MTRATMNTSGTHAAARPPIAALQGGMRSAETALCGQARRVEEEAIDMRSRATARAKQAAFRAREETHALLRDVARELEGLGAWFSAIACQINEQVLDSQTVEIGAAASPLATVPDCPFAAGGSFVGHSPPHHPRDPDSPEATNHARNGTLRPEVEQAINALDGEELREAVERDRRELAHERSASLVRTGVVASGIEGDADAPSTVEVDGEQWAVTPLPKAEGQAEQTVSVEVAPPPGPQLTAVPEEIARAGLDPDGRPKNRGRAKRKGG